MSEDRQLRLVQLTPPGRGAIATLRIEGPGALRAVAAQFTARSGRPLAELPRDRLAVGHFGGPGGEEVVVRTLSDEALEVHCHGGVAALALIEETLAAAAGASGGLSQFSSAGPPGQAENGTVPFSHVAWQEWVGQQERDPIAAAARIALAQARTPRDRRHPAGPVPRRIAAAPSGRSKPACGRATGRRPLTRPMPSWPGPRWACTWSGRGKWSWPGGPTPARAA